MEEFVKILPASVAMFDREMRYLYVSDRWLEDFRLDIPNILGKSHYEIFPEIPEHWKDIHKRCLAGASEKNDAEAFVRADGTIDWIRWEIRPWYDAFDQIGGILIFSLDISDKIRIEMKARENAENNLKIRDEFIAIAAHELKTPMAALKMQTQLVRKFLDGEGFSGSPKFDRLKKILKNSESQIDQYSKLVNDLLNITRTSTGLLSLEISRFDLRDCVNEIVEHFSAKIAEAHCEIQIHSSGAVTGNWDKLRIVELIGNLIANAIKYGAGRPIDIKVEESKNWAYFSIQDRGIGIPMEDQIKIFNKFERSANHKNFGGFGIGLYIVRKIVEAHHGKIRVESEPGLGANFIIELPMDLEIDQSVNSIQIIS